MQREDHSTPPATLVEVLRSRAGEHGERRLYTFLVDGEEEAGQLSYAGLDRRARAVATALQEAGAAGQPVLLLFKPGLDFISAFLGCLYAGAVAVPAYPPASKRHLPRLQAIAADARPRQVLTTTGTVARIRAAIELLPELAAAGWIETDTVEDGLAAGWRDPGLTGESPAFLQYTSGSTATPKGVRVSHGNLLHNEELIRGCFGLDAEAVIVGWLPLYHDMGLIGNVLHPLYLGASCVLMSPVAFLQRPLRWLRAIERWGGTTSGGPNFAYELCAQRVTAEQKRGLDLSGWRVAFSGAEPVRAETLDRFAAAFAECGFRREAFYPCYGMAETTLMVTGGDPRWAPVVAPVSAPALEQHRVVAPTAGEETRRLVSCGAAGSGLEVRIVDPERRVERAADAVGEIWVAGPSVAHGYLERPEENAATFGARLADGTGPYLRTGDLGFLRGGELYVTGRIKDLIILRGRNHYPQDLELTAQRSHPSLRAGCGAAVAAEIDGAERLVIVHEIERRPSDEPEVIADALRRAVAAAHEVQVVDVVLLRQATIPKTSSGKIRRRACLAGYLEGNLATVGRSAVAASAADAAVGVEVELDRSALLALPAAERRPLVAAFLTDRFARLSRVAVSRVAPDRPLTSLGLDSLSAAELQAAVAERLEARLDLEALLEGASVDELAASVVEQLDAAPAVAAPTAGPVSVEHPLSHGQLALWYVHHLDPASAAYHIAGAARTGARLDIGALERAFVALVRRHGALRTVFAAAGAEPVARVDSEPRLDFRVEAAAAWSDAAIARRLADEAHRPFDLTVGPLLRVVVLRGGGAGGDAVGLTVHHIVADFWSLGLMLGELGELYRAETGGPAALLEPPAFSYGEVARWQRRRMAGEEGERLWAYWQEQLGGELPLLDLPTDRPRPALQSFRGASRRRLLSAGLTAPLESLAKAGEATLFMTLLAAFQALLHRWSGQRDLLVGSPMRGRTAPGLDGLVGYLVNPVALRSDASGDPPFTDFLAATRRAAIGALAHQDYPFGLLVERLEPSHDPGRSPLFQAMFAWQQDRGPEEAGLAGFAVGAAGTRLALGSFALEALPLPRRAAQFDVALVMAEVGGRLAAALETNVDLFDATTAERWLRHLESLLAAVADDPGRRLSQLPLFTAAQRQQMVVEWAQRGSYPRRLCLHQLVEEQARRTPTAAALVSAAETLTYRQLDARATALAGRLRRLGVRPERTVAVISERVEEVVPAMLAVWKAGGVYLPLDPSLPPDRRDFLLRDAAARVLLGDAGGELPETVEHVLPLSGEPLAAAADGDAPAVGWTVRPEQLAYLIYTSGTTGQPKGVAVAHAQAVPLHLWSRGAFGFGPHTRVLQTLSYFFDFGVMEVLTTLMSGGTLHVPEPGERGNLTRLAELIEQHRVNTVHATPSFFQELTAGGRRLPSLEVVHLGGEALRRELIRQIEAAAGGGCRVYNGYGPTEATINCSIFRLQGTPLDGGFEGPVAPLGRATANSSIQLLDRQGLPVPVGVPGELTVGGDGVTRGYLGRPAATAERFVPDPCPGHPPASGVRLYRTGDLARWTTRGEIEFLGRLDHQVKVRGFRIELEEIESALGDHAAVAEAVVVARSEPGGETRLVAYVVAAGEQSDTAALKSHLGGRLPGYMVPQAILFLGALPISPNGKVDRGALPAPDQDAYASTAAYVAPETAVEQLVAGMWSEVLGVERIGIDDSFFDLGGHSLKATQVLSRVYEAFGVELPLRSLLEAPTVRGLTEAIARQLLAAADAATLADLE